MSVNDAVQLPLTLLVLVPLVLQPNRVKPSASMAITARFIFINGELLENNVGRICVMEEAAFCTMLGLNVGPYRKQLRFREVPLGQGATLPMCLATMIFVLNTVPGRMYLRSGRFRTK